jgi:Predicted NTPase (NACHT family)
LAKTNAEDEVDPAVEFIEKLGLPENYQFRRLAITPLFLHLACWVFRRQEKFPTKKSEFYKQCLDLLLVKWDETRGIQRDAVYRGFLLPQKLKLLSQVAAVSFEQGDYFLEQHALEEHIGDYIRDLPNASTEPEELQLDSEVVLKAIELQHGLLTERVRGIFSFSYLAFQEYFTARKIVASHNLQALEKPLERLVSHVTEPRWREIFLLTAAMLRSADSLVQLMKQHVDGLVAQDPYLQEFLTWASQKSQAVPPQPSAIRAFYFALARTPHLAPQFALACTLDQGIFLDAALDNLVLESGINSSSDFVHAYACADALSHALTIVLDLGLQQSLQQLQDQVPDSKQDRERFQAWWQTNHVAWSERLREAISIHRNIQHQWHFTTEQQQVLQRYYDANQLLIDCLNSNCEVTAAVRQEIEAALLLPQKELEEREWQ